MLEIDKVLIFDLWGDYAHFRRGYTTTSPLTYPFPSRTTLAGILAAILGFQRDSYYEYFRKHNSAFALQILKPIKKIRINLNLIDTKTGFYLWDNKGQRTQIPFEFLKDAKYRVYVWIKDKEIFNDLKDLIRNHKSFYTPYLGISECIANFNVFKGGIFDIERKKATKETEIHSIIKKDSGKIKIEPKKKYGLIKVPGFMDKDRVVSEYIEFFYEEEGKPLLISEGEYYNIKGENVNIIFF